mmetsp:Transcript_33928/g.33054  ORF Transcript_33928/g.33054 Transcript_33928/m.33054 type:complete len:103 (-) Transcript_33928:545-853(-)
MQGEVASSDPLLEVLIGLAVFVDDRVKTGQEQVDDTTKGPDIIGRMKSFHVLVAEEFWRNMAVELERLVEISLRLIMFLELMNIILCNFIFPICEFDFFLTC